jgi:hypothetical protein
MESPDTSYQERGPDEFSLRADHGADHPGQNFETQFAAIERPAYKLHSPGDVLLATFLGGPPAGTVVLAVNYFK